MSESNKRITIVADGFGGDHAPDEVLKGAAKAVAALPCSIIITGNVSLLEERLSALGLPHKHIVFEQADGVIHTEDNPLDIRKSKLGTSMGKAFTLLKTGAADAMISAGSTAALLIGGTFIIGRIPGVKRPAFCPEMPSLNGKYLLIDGGANSECRADMLLQFAQMADVYAKQMYDMPNPRIALLSNGTEREKGRDLEREAYALLQKSRLNFVGYAEGRDPTLGECDIIVTDGYTGNIYLKTVEGMGKFMSYSLKGIFKRNAASNLAYLLAKSGVKDLTKRTDYREIGGTPLLGAAKPVIKAHGSSDERAFFSTFKQAVDFVRAGGCDKIAAAMTADKQQ
ncbi:MAG: phosphate acyltransferase PlsX [Oscillospiraceae bacterium]|jgi:glycerol-3-phosphate acyltransferase PlsX|nr:phosphate acyltransferase PlsX [Oscillospiraceae bacterium]